MLQMRTHWGTIQKSCTFVSDYFSTGFVLLKDKVFTHFPSSLCNETCVGCWLRAHDALKSLSSRIIIDQCLVNCKRKILNNKDQ